MSTTAISVFVVSPDTRSERRYDLHLTVEQLKRKLEPVTGIPADSQSITVHEQGAEDDDRAVVLATLDDDSRPLGYYGIRDWQVLKVIDKTPSTALLAGQFTDVSQVQKFEISQEEYATRRDTLLAYKQAHKIGRFAPPSAKDTEEFQEPPVNITLDSRCEVELGDSGLRKRGKVRFVGTTKFAKGIWVGIEYDEPLGKNDGSVQGVQYFTCHPSYGGFIRPDRVHIGDFPVEDLEAEEEI